MSGRPAQQAESEARSPLPFLTNPGKRTFVLSLVLVVLTLGIYNQATHFGFINYDDNHYVYDNPNIRTGLGWHTIRWALSSFEQANWHPLTWISHALDYQLFRLNPAGHHFSSILLHAFNVVLLFLLLTWSTRTVTPSFLVAALFAVHPLNVESVVWVAERKNVLSTTLFLLTLGAYGWYALKPGWKRYCVMAGLLACGLASKPMLVTTPFVLLLLDYWPLGRIRGGSAETNVLGVQESAVWKLVLEKLPLLLLAGASCVLTVMAQRASGAVGTIPFPFWARLQNAIYSYAMYLWKAVWPSHLALFYPYSGRSIMQWRVFAAALLLAGVSALVIRLRSRRPYLLTGWLWFLGTLVPVIGVIQVGNQSMADRYAYIPLIGVFMMGMWACSDWWKQKGSATGWQAFLGLSVIAALSVTTYIQIGYWQDSLTIWTHALGVTQRNFVAEENLGVALVQLGRVEEAYPHFVSAAQEEPNDPVARLNIGAYQQQHGHVAEAITEYSLALQLGAEPSLRSTTYSNLGSAYSGVGDYAKARASFEEAVRLDPNQASAWQGLAWVCRQQGDAAEGLQALSRAVQIRPTADGYLELARALAQANRGYEAMAAYQQAVKLAPGLRGVQPTSAKAPNAMP